MAINTVLTSFAEAFNLSCCNSRHMALPMFVILVPLEIFSIWIKGSQHFTIDLTSLINLKSPDFPFVVVKTKAEIRVGDLLISVLSTILIAQFSCMARLGNKASLDYYIKGLQKTWHGSVVALSYIKIFYILPVTWMMLLPLIEQWSLVVVLIEEEGNCFTAIAKACSFVGKRKKKVLFLMGVILVINLLALIVPDFVSSDNLMGKVVLFGPDRIVGDTFCYFVTFYTYLWCMVFYDREK